MPTRILVIEDQAHGILLYTDLLAELGYEPVVVRSGEAALGLLGTERPDVILLDLSLPGMSGFDFLRQASVRASGIPVVAISGAATEAAARECLELGALDFVPKPAPLDLLRHLLRYAESRAGGQAGADGGGDRRRSRRRRIAIPVRGVNGGTWQGTTIDIATFGLRLHREQGPPAPTARLTFAPPDGGSMLSLLSLLVRAEPDGYAFRFVNLTASQFERLQELVEGARAD
jgi:CheY-like chemotaxis protein